MSKHFLAISDSSKSEILKIFDLAEDLKSKQKNSEPHRLLEAKTLAMIFAKPSARTRVSFEVGMFQLGGHALYLGPNDIQIGKRESVGDVSQVLSRYVDIIMARLFDHEDILELAKHATIPVVNGLTDLLHPCQIVADLFTIYEHKGRRDNLKIAYVGDGYNVANSWINIASKIPMTLSLAIPDGYDPDDEVLRRAKQSGVSEVQIFREPAEAVQSADVIYTDSWVSMGQEAETEKRKIDFRDFQVNAGLLKHAAADCLVMHCLPAHRGDEITDEVIDGPHAIVFDEAENRLHVQKAIMVKLLA